MEWLGINLNYAPHRTWQRQSLRALLTLAISLSLSLTIATILLVSNQHHHAQLQQQRQQLAEKQEIVHRLTQQILHLTTPDEHSTATTIPPAQFREILRHLYQLPLQGGVSQLTLDAAEPLSLSLIGQLPAASFAELEQQLKTAALHYKLLHLQANEDELLDFHLLLEWENTHEKPTESLLP